jgi:hypothetical protein
MKEQDEQMFAYATWMAKYGGFAKDMTMRDHFAGLAMQGFMANKTNPLHFQPEDDATWAYQIADAMLKAREK